MQKWEARRNRIRSTSGFNYNSNLRLGKIIFIVLVFFSLNCTSAEIALAANMTLNHSVLKASEHLLPLEAYELKLPLESPFVGVYMPEALLTNMSIPVGGVTRDQVSEPVSYTNNVNDKVIFEDARDPSRKLYLPRYKIAVETVSGQQRYRVSLKNGIHGWSLIVHLTKYAAPEIEDAVRDADEINHTVSVLLHYKDADGLQEKPFQEMISGEDGIRALLNLNDLKERDEIYKALTDPNYSSALIIKRMVSLEVPARVSYGSIVLGTQGMFGMTFLSLDNGSSVFMEGSNATYVGDMYDLLWRVIGIVAGNPVPDCPNCTSTPDQTWLHMQPTEGVGLSNLGIIDFDSIDIEGLQNIIYDYNTILGSQGSDNQLPPGDVFAVRTKQENYAKVQVLDYGEDISIRWETYPKIPHFSIRNFSLDEIIKPFIFDKDLHLYIFHELNSPTPGSQSLIRIVINGHSYYQDSSRRQVFYYLPDSFKIARNARSPHMPEMLIRFKSADQVELSYVAMPYVDPLRLKEDLSKLKQIMSNDDSLSIEEPFLEPLNVDPSNIGLEIALPSKNSTRELYQVRNEILVSLVDGFSDRLIMDTQDFQYIFDSLFGVPADLLFQGRILVQVHPGSTESVPFIGRMNDLIGPIFDYQVIQDNASSSINVNLTNAIESPFIVRRWDAEVQRGGFSAEACVIAPDLPVRLEPGEGLNLTLIPVEDLAGNAPFQVTFGTKGVEVIPDKDAIWNYTVDKNVPTVPVNISIKTFIFMDQENVNDIFEVIVLFEDGSFVELMPQSPAAEITLQMSLKDRILHSPNLGEYSYTVKTIYSNGTIAMSEKMTETSRLLIA